MKSYFSHLVCSKCGQEYAPDRLLNLCTCGFPLLACYHLDRVRQEVEKTVFQTRPATLWRYWELLPVLHPENCVSLGEGGTPLLELPRLGRKLGFSHLYVKDEGNNPTASFKARGLAVAVSKAKELGAKKLAIPSAGNAAGAMSAYAARAGLEAIVVMPEDVPPINSIECAMAGARVSLVKGLITDAGRMIQQARERYGWFDVSTLKEPYRIEGKKTMGLELAEDFQWELPDLILYPTGGGTGLIGMWKAFDELEHLGWISSHRPRMVSVQATGCAPIVKAFTEGADSAPYWEGAQTIAAGMRVPKAIGDFLMLKVLRESGGTAIAVSDEAMLEAQRLWGKEEGLFVAPEGAATLAALLQLKERGEVQPEERIVLFNTASGLKYTHLLHFDFPVLGLDQQLTE
ncbi:MAG: threonine synthase [Nitrospinota bacterium]|nr:MAG: threonine synthase [Nitrospinota bacterium]